MRLLEPIETVLFPATPLAGSLQSYHSSPMSSFSSFSHLSSPLSSPSASLSSPYSTPAASPTLLPLTPILPSTLLVDPNTSRKRQHTEPTGRDPLATVSENTQYKRGLEFRKDLNEMAENTYNGTWKECLEAHFASNEKHKTTFKDFVHTMDKVELVLIMNIILQGRALQGNEEGRSSETLFR